MHRRHIHYWKCDREDAFHTPDASSAARRIQPVLQSLLAKRFDCVEPRLNPRTAQGIHLTWTAHLHDTPVFIRVEHGQEIHSQLGVESALLDRLPSLGVPVPTVIASDDSHQDVPFGWQILEHIPFPDLNHWHKCGQLDHEAIPFQIGRNIALWQSMDLQGFGILEIAPEENLIGGHTSYASYFNLNLARHLDFLVLHGFIDTPLCKRILDAIACASHLLDLTQGVLVHKDLALWNILGSSAKVAAFIDFEDAVSGDASEDLALLACFHRGSFVDQAINGYQSIKRLPTDFTQRFWLHLLRNMLVKAVIRVGGGYFNRNDSFFLINQGDTGSDLECFTRSRIFSALDGLEKNLEINDLNLP